MFVYAGRNEQRVPKAKNPGVLLHFWRDVPVARMIGGRRMRIERSLFRWLVRQLRQFRKLELGVRKIDVDQKMCEYVGPDVTILSQRAFLLHNADVTVLKLQLANLDGIHIAHVAA